MPPSPPPLPGQAAGTLPRGRLQVLFVTVCAWILLWTCLIQLLSFGRLWRHPPAGSAGWSWVPSQLLFRFRGGDGDAGVPRVVLQLLNSPPPAPLPRPRERNYKSNGYLKVSCNGGLNQMRAAICDMVTVARFLNLTLVVPELDKKSFWADPSDFDDIFDASHFIDSLRDEVRIVKRLPKSIYKNVTNNLLVMPPVSWSDEKYYLEQILPLYNKYSAIHFNKTDARLANNGVSVELQKLRCRVNYEALRFTPQIEALGNKVIQMLRERGQFVALHLRYEMDMLAFSGCTHGCSPEEAEELKKMRYAYPWWREKEINSTARRLQGLCPLTPEETTLILKAMKFNSSTQIYIASGEIYRGENRLKELRAAFPSLVKKEALLDPEDLRQFQNHSSQMAALDYMVSLASDIFIATYDGNMAKVVEGHRRYLGFKKTLLLDRKGLVELLDLHKSSTLGWDEFSSSVRHIHEKSFGQPNCRKVIANKHKDEDYFYANPHECLTNAGQCHESGSSGNSSPTV